jgi:hypothetical protein
VSGTSGARPAITLLHLFKENLMKHGLLICGLLMATAAYAGPGKPQPLDTDGDQLISLAEAQAGAPELALQFSELDSNHDGMLSIDEVAANQPKGMVRFTRDIQEDFAAADTNGDGMLARAEADGKMPIVSDFFGEMDANKDGYVTMDEIHEHARKQGPIRVFRTHGPAAASE